MCKRGSNLLFWSPQAVGCSTSRVFKWHLASGGGGGGQEEAAQTKEAGGNKKETALDPFTVNLNAKAENGKIDPLLG